VSARNRGDGPRAGDVRTVVLAELNEQADELVGDLLRDALRAAAGTLTTTGGEDRRTIGAALHLASDASLVAVRALRALAAAPPDDDLQVRMAMCTGMTTGEGTTVEGPALQRARHLLDLAFTGQVLVAASTADMVGPTLPSGVELYDRGCPAGAGLPRERVYELRAAAGDADGASNLDWARRAAHGPVIGRDAPLAALDAAWQATLRGDRRAVLLVGEGGIGKTTVAAELALRLHAEGALVLYGRWDDEEYRPYQALREALGTYARSCSGARLREDIAGHGDEIARLLPDVGRRIGGAAPALHRDPETERLRLFTAIRMWLRAVAGRSPVLVILDDFHAAVRPSQMLVEHLLEAMGDEPIMIVVAGRSAEADATGARAANAAIDADIAGLERIPLAGLDVSVVTSLIAEAVGRPLAPDDDELIEWLKSETASNPLYLEEALASVRRAPDAWEAFGKLRHQVPERLADMVWGRVTQLPPDVVDVLVDGAVAGATFDLDLLAGATNLPMVTLRGPLDEITRAGWLRTETGERFYFTHNLVRRVLRDRLPAERATTLHRRIAATLARRARTGHPVSEAEVADHYLLGVNHELVGEAVDWARRAARTASGETAFELAVELLSRAVDAQERFAGLAGGGGSRCELLIELAEALDRTGAFGARDARCLEAANLARELVRDDLLVRAALGYGGRLPAAAPPDATATSLLEEALERVRATDRRARATLLARLAQLPEPDSGTTRRRERADEALALARLPGAPAELARVLMARAFVFDGPDDVDEHVAIGAEVTEIGESTGDLDLVLQGARARIPALLAAGRHEEARGLADTFTRLARELHHPDHLRISRMWEIFWCGLRGDYDRAEALAVELHRQLVTSGHPQATAISFAQAFARRWFTGEAPATRSDLEAAQDGGLSSDCVWALSAWTDALAGRRDDALTALAGREPGAFVAGLERDFMWWPTIIACTAVATSGDRRWAAVLHDALVPHAGRNVVIGFTAFGGAVDHHLGTVSLVLGRADDAVQRLDAGLDRHRALGAAPFVALSCQWAARALRLRGRLVDRDRAVRLEDEAAALTDRFGLRGLTQA
jgi:hypothetical protein